MKAATKLLARRAAREREARGVAHLREHTLPSPAPLRANDHSRLTLPLSYAPYRLQAANRWWREIALLSEPTRKRSTR
jgi:hypothetical protein